MDNLALKTQKTNTIVKFDAKNLLELLNGSLAEIIEDVLNSLMKQEQCAKKIPQIFSV